ncbi:MAG: diphthamide biosynthesis enzyme Dph2 [Cenarchaeum sp. SB0665_bin_23]|nr:diphthamide biosynthesis enzyme Dph2 [Cenarchaeum sp. SB0664_bin_35]MXY61334.1 diphthamide biosynthesis enzyme Dph2 [Cenarchaeum sp. SB0665_bin_23]MYB47590.1 diphthamide biosynthesis enzyme Dph2 [Cenarchaeum sp. SB0662_bin_33]MYG32650.1 diphthamide biosynthesis enzyme Dph2 [Cenarchaeum sp. SB0677_bin_16]
MIVIDEERIFNEIYAKKPQSVSLNGPEGILAQVQQTAINITRKFDIPAFVIADATWGSCDINESGARTLGAGIHFNIGHTVSMDTVGNTVMVDAYDDVSFDSVALKCARLLRSGIVAVVTDSQHLHQIQNVVKILQKNGIRTIIGSGKGQLNDGQVFGCEFYPATSLRDDVDSYVFLGQSNFHAAGVALSTGKPTYVLDPYFNEVREVSEFAESLRKKATLAIYKAADAKRFGIIVGLKEGQLSKVVGLKFKRELESLGKEVEMFALTDITNERLLNIRNVDAFIQVACPRISTDNRFDMPVLSTPQAQGLLRVLQGKDPQEYLMLPHWL